MGMFSDHSPKHNRDRSGEDIAPLIRLLAHLREEQVLWTKRQENIGLGNAPPTLEVVVGWISKIQSNYRIVTGEPR